MYDINHILIDGCPLCDLFKQSSQHILYYDKDRLKDCDFALVKSNPNDLVIIRDHTEYASNNICGRIIYICREMYGNDVKIKYRPQNKYEHWYALIEG